ncbi:hypothetical protein [Variovorax soli]|nr:hypothetical protein [Variovorax soli]
MAYARNPFPSALNNIIIERLSLEKEKSEKQRQDYEPEWMLWFTP